MSIYGRDGLEVLVAFAEVEGAELGGVLARVIEGVHQEDITQAVDGVEVGSEALSEPSVAPSEGE